LLNQKSAAKYYAKAPQIAPLLKTLFLEQEIEILRVETSLISYPDLYHPGTPYKLQVKISYKAKNAEVARHFQEQLQGKYQNVEWTRTPDHYFVSYHD